jgi:BCD family chlorophyll transporter-like MFS transporter
MTAPASEAQAQRAGSGLHEPGLSWFEIFRLGLVQTALGAIVVLTTSTINRVMVLEMAMPAMLPGALVGLHYALQILRPRWGHHSDVKGRRSPWILIGMAVLASGGWLAALATSMLDTRQGLGIALATVAFSMIGLGVGASGTSLLALLAKSVAPKRRPAAATMVWVMMIMGFVITAATAGHYLDPYSSERLVQVSAAVSLTAFALSVIALYGLEAKHPVSTVFAPSQEPRGHQHQDAASCASASFWFALKAVWSETSSRRFTIFVFISMLAYSAQDLILEPFAGAVFGMSPGESTQLAGVQHGGVLFGMIFVALIGTWRKSGHSVKAMRRWTVSGCAASALALFSLSGASMHAGLWPLQACVLALGFTNGVFAVAAIGSMMTLAGEGKPHQEGLRMGLWGAAQAIAFGLGGFLGTMASDIAQWLLADASQAYAWVFGLQALLFLISAWMALRVPAPADDPSLGLDKARPGSPWTSEVINRDRRLDSQRERLNHATIG